MNLAGYSTHLRDRMITLLRNKYQWLRGPNSGSYISSWQKFTSRATRPHLSNACQTGTNVQAWESTSGDRSYRRCRTANLCCCLGASGGAAISNLLHVIHGAQDGVLGKLLYLNFIAGILLECLRSVGLTVCMAMRSVFSFQRGIGPLSVTPLASDNNTLRRTTL